MKWFNGISNLKELHKRLIQLAKKHHPDVGGSEKIMKEINMEYDEAADLIKSGFFEYHFNFQHSDEVKNKKYDYYKPPHKSSKKYQYKPSEDEDFDTILDTYVYIAYLRGYKPGWIANAALKHAKSYEDCLKIARKCGYKDGWAHYKWNERREVI